MSGEVRETFAYYLSEAENGWCKIPRRVADDMAQSYAALQDQLAAEQKLGQMLFEGREPFESELLTARAEIASLQQHLSDCKSSLRAVEAERDEARKRAGKLHDYANMRDVQIVDLVARAEAAEAREKQVRAALEQISTVCDDNAPETCRHDLALKFVRDVARTALASKEGGNA